MKRYTESITSVDLKPKGYHLKQMSECPEAINKLGKLEDLEEKLDCPLEVLGKVILQNCFYDIYGNIIETNIGYINQEGTTGIVMSVKEWEMGNTLLLSDYKKTWWLKEDKSE